MAKRKQFVDRDVADFPTQLLQLVERLIDLPLPPLRFGNESCNRTTMPGDDYRLAPLDFIEQAGEMHLGLGGLNFAWHGVFSIGRNDWSI
jgi:hypothetical protein